jgi:TrmH family RNA methyltransferase
MEKITSDANKKYKYWVSLTESKGLKKSEHFLLSGKNFVMEYIKNQATSIDCLLFREDMPVLEENFKAFALERKLFSKLDIFGTDSFLAVIKKPELLKWDKELIKGLQVLLPLGDPQNMGSFLRNAAAFKANNIVLLKESCSPFHPKALRASAGNIRNFSFYEGPSISEIADLNLENLYCLDMNGKELNSHNLPENLLLLVGEEGPGVPQILRHKANTISIPMDNGVESLNASFSASLVCYEYFKKFNASK